MNPSWDQRTVVLDKRMAMSTIMFSNAVWSGWEVRQLVSFWWSCVICFLECLAFIPGRGKLSGRHDLDVAIDVGPCIGTYVFVECPLEGETLLIRCSLDLPYLVVCVVLLFGDILFWLEPLKEVGTVTRVFLYWSRKCGCLVLFVAGTLGPQNKVFRQLNMPRLGADGRCRFFI